MAVRFATEEEAVKSCELNGTMVEGNAIRVDMSLNDKTHDQNKVGVYIFPKLIGIRDMTK